MINGDFSVQHSGLNGAITQVSALTEKALPNSEFEVHRHYQEFEIYYFLEGDLFFSFEGKHIKVQEGCMIIISNSMLHRPIIKNECRYFRKRILFNKEIFIKLGYELYNILKKRNILVLGKNTVEKSGLDKLFLSVEEHLALGSSYDDFCALISLLSLLITAEKNSERIDDYISFTHSEKVSEIIDYINRHLTEDLSYKILSEAFYLSEKYLYKIFKNETGFTLSDYIKERRIIMAQSILNAGGSAKTAAYSSGFKDYSAFYRCFSKKVGITPTEYIRRETTVSKFATARRDGAPYK